MAVHVFAPGEHDEFVCAHVMAGHDPAPVTHNWSPDGSVSVDFPTLPPETIEAALLTYDRADYEVEPVPGDILLDVFATLGKLKARSLARDYPDAMLAIDHKNWPVLFAAVQEMVTNGDLSSEEYQGVVALLASHGVSYA